MKKSTAVLIPCYNESKTIAKVVSDYRAVLPEAWTSTFMTTIPLTVPMQSRARLEQLSAMSTGREREM